jgi:hypothetical protein
MPRLRKNRAEAVILAGTVAVVAAVVGWLLHTLYLLSDVPAP